MAAHRSNQHLNGNVSREVRESKALEKGDIVQISQDINKTKQLQVDHGGYLPIMKTLAGKIGKVKSIFSFGILVKINGIEMVYNPLLLTRLEKSDLSVFAPGADSDSDSNSNIIKKMAKIGKFLEILSLLSVDHEDSQIVNERTRIFFKAVVTGNLVEVNNLEDSILVNTNFRNVYPLMVAVNKGHYEVAKLLIEKKADLNAQDEDGDTALHLAVLKDQFELCHFLLKKGADVNIQNNSKLTPMMIAAALGSQNILKLLVNSKNADLNIGDSDKDTALHLAINKSQIKSVEILLNAGADIEKLNEKQFNPFHLAALRGDEKILEMFLKREGAKIVNSQKEDKFSAMHLAAVNNHEGCLRVLLKYKADINIRNSQLQTPLHVAVSQKYLKIVKILVENKADLNMKDEDGDTPLHVALITKNNEFIRNMGRLFGMGGALGLMMTLVEGSDKPEDIAIYLIENGARKDLRNDNGKMPIDLCNDVLMKTKIFGPMNDYSGYIELLRLKQELRTNNDNPCRLM